MAYSQEVYSRAAQTLERRRERANLEAQARIDEIGEKLPEINEIQRKLAQIGLNISKVFLYSADKQADMEKLMQESLELQEQKKNILKKNGYSEDALDIRYTCPACKDTGFIGSRRCKCHNELLKDIERSDLAKIAPIKDCTFESFKVLEKYYPKNTINLEKIKASCVKYAINFSTNSKNVILYGGVGVGKTHLALAIANVVINKGFSVIFGTIGNIISDLQHEEFGNNENLQYYKKAILNCDLLIIDDLGTEILNASRIAILYNIINSRLLSKLPTIITTNYTEDELEEKYDQRIFSRIQGEYRPLTIDGRNIRYLKEQ